MRRYAGKSSPFTLGKIMVFFGAWNLIGYFAYKYIIKKEEEKEPGLWESASGAQHVLRFMGFGSETVKKITLKGISSVTVKDLTTDDIQKLKGYETTKSES